MASRASRVGRSIGSIRLALVLFCGIIVILFVGAVVPEQLQPLIFHSWWFIALLAVFGLNLSVCLVSRLRASRGGLGSKLTHAAVLVILAGAAVSFLAAQRGTVELTKGEERTSFCVGDGEKPLGFSVRLEDFAVEWYRPRYFKLGVKVEDRGFRKKFEAVPGREYRVGETGYTFTVKDYFPEFAVDEEGQKVNLSDKALNPAVLVEIRSPAGTEQRWVFAFHPDLQMGDDGNIRVVFLEEPSIREFRSRLRFSEGARMVERSVKVNSPVEFAGYTFYQSGYDPQRPEWTSLEVVRDPGTPIVFAGFALLNVGIAVLYLRRWLAERK